jgi:hypothetical protein
VPIEQTDVNMLFPPVLFIGDTSHF